MSRLIQIEIRKNIRYPAFWIILGLHYFFLISFLTNINNLSGSFNFSSSEYQNIDLNLVPIFKFPDIWQNITYLAGFFKILLGIYMVISVTNEFQYNTIRLNLTSGLTRLEFLISKFLVAFIISLFSVFILFDLGIFVGLIKNAATMNQDFFEKISFLSAYFLEILFYMTLAIFFSTWLQKTGISIFMLLIYPLLIEPVIRWQIPDAIDQYFPVKAMDNLNVFPFPKYFGFTVMESVPLDCTLVTIGWIFIIFFATYLLIRQKSL